MPGNKVRTCLVAAGMLASLPAAAHAQSVGFMPVIGTIPEGDILAVVPVVSADRRYVRLTLNPQFIGFQRFDVATVPAAVGGGPGGPGALGGLGGLGGAGGGGGGGGGGARLGLGGQGQGAGLDGGLMLAETRLGSSTGGAFDPLFGGPRMPQLDAMANLVGDDLAARPRARFPRTSRAKARVARAPTPPPPPEVLADRRATSKLRQAEALAKDGKSAPALAYYREVLAEYPGTPQADSASRRIKALAAAQVR